MQTDFQNCHYTGWRSKSKWGISEPSLKVPNVEGADLYVPLTESNPVLSVSVLTAPGWSTEGRILRGHQGGIWRGQTGPLWLTEGNRLVVAAGKLMILCFIKSPVEVDRRRRLLTVRLFVLPQDRKYLSLSQARDKALSIDWLAQPRPGKLDGDKL